MLITKLRQRLQRLNNFLPFPMPANTKALHLQQGEHYEQLAFEYLLAQGLQEVTRNYRCRFGELDLVMRDQDYLVIIEVRYRKSAIFGSAAESITPRKQSRIIAATKCYLAAQPINKPIRFDVIAITGKQHFEWIKNAFQT